MKVGELFVDLVVKGGDKAQKELSGASKGMRDLWGTGLAAKAAVIGVLYGLERMTSSLAQSGMELQQFGAATGLSVEELQKWQYAASQFGVSGQEITGTVKAIQDAMVNMQLGRGAPEGFNIFADAVQLDKTKINDTFYLMKKLQEFAKHGNAAVGRNLIKSLGVGDNVYQFLRLNQQDIDKVKPSKIFSANEIKQLARVDAAWARLWNTIKKVSGAFVSQHGLEAVTTLSTGLNELVTVTAMLAKQAHEFPRIAKGVGLLAVAFAAWMSPIAAAAAGITGLVYLLGELEKHKQGKASALDNLPGFDSKMPGPVPNTEPRNDNAIQRLIRDGLDKVIGPAPQYRPPEESGPKKPLSVTVNQNFQHPGDEPQQLADASRKGINEAFRSNPAQTQIA